MDNHPTAVAVESKMLFSCPSMLLVYSIAFSLCVFFGMKDGSIACNLSEATTNCEADEMNPKRIVRLKVISEMEQYGVLTEFTLLDAEGISFERFCESGVMEKMLSRNINIQFRHTQEEKHDKAVVVKFYPKVFTEGCVVLVEIDGPLPKN